MKTAFRISWWLPVAAAVVLGGCSGWNADKVLPDRRVEYKKSREAGTDLELPPDLSAMSIATGEHLPDAGTSPITTYSEYSDARGPQTVAGSSGRTVLPENPTVELKRDGQQRWLVIDGEPDAVWDSVIGFWRDNGILLMEQDPVAGVMRTAWIENRADIKSDFITDAVRGLFDGLYSSGTRDQYRVRLEQGAGENTT